ncbi:kinase-interacting protein 1-like [Rutidosis leptorrhynchoides]|uniref:kinase-interacting protein 1-like n=1 Tax=Rutidosis leptorrhynchoides TaxID=125765 RepID=UPI003A996A03
MLQRAASNAYSWWWASHIRTKQSKWLEQSLQDMEEKVANALNIIQKDGDSFAKRAEMYYKHRPELIAFIEESVRAYRALAERYDKLSTDLQKANTTIATVFPDQLSYDTDYEDDDNDTSAHKLPKNVVPDPPKAPKAPETKNLKTFLTNGPNKTSTKVNDHQSNHFSKSELTTEEGVEEIDKLQKEILFMQTVKEFTRSSYENGIAKFTGIEKRIVEMQQRVCDLQDEFNVVKVIEDDDARAIMAAAALKSCEESLVTLQAKHEKSTQDALLEHERIQNVKSKLCLIKHEYFKEIDHDHDHDHDLDHDHDQEHKVLSADESKKTDLQEKIKGSLEDLSTKDLTVTEMADTIDKLVTKVFGLETLVSSQTALIERLRMETDDLQMQIRDMENDKGNLVDGTRYLDKSFKEMEKKLEVIQNLGNNIDDQNNNLKMQFTEANYNVTHLSENLHNMKPDEEFNLNNPFVDDEDEMLPTDYQHLLMDLKSKEQVEEKEITWTNDDDVKNNDEITEFEAIEKKEHIHNSGNKDTNPFNDDVLEPKEQEEEVKEELNWQELLLGAFDDKEKVLLQEYTTILRKYKAAKKELIEEERKNQGTLVEMKLQVKELKTLVAKRDVEVQEMKRKLKLLQENDMVDSNEEITKFEDNVKSVIEVVKSEPFERKLRTNIDAILDENLDFWLRFSSSFHQVQKFKTEVEDLQQEIVKVKAKGSEKLSIKSGINAIYKHIKEIQNELTIWLEQSVLLKNELQRKSSSLSEIHEDITKALREGVEDDEIKFRFSTHQAAKFEGEVLNMQQESRKVNRELEAGLDHVVALQVETEKILRKLEEEFGLVSDQKQARLPNRPHVPLRSFIFGTKSKKQKPSILACINPHKRLTTSDSGNF